MACSPQHVGGAVVEHAEDRRPVELVGRLAVPRESGVSCG